MNQKIMETYTYQDITVNVLDIDTKKVICEDFVIRLYPVDGSLLNDVPNRLIKHGSAKLTNVPINSSGGFISVIFDHDQLRSYGYQEVESAAEDHIELDITGRYGIVREIYNIYLQKIA
jgi:hypothetical protein